MKTGERSQPFMREKDPHTPDKAGLKSDCWGFVAFIRKCENRPNVPENALSERGLKAAGELGRTERPGGLQSYFHKDHPAYLRK